MFCVRSGSACFPRYVLDRYPTTLGGFGLRRLKSNYTGACIRVRRSSDNSELDIGFVGDDLDTAALSSFIGVFSAYVTTWYDQSGNGNNRTQTTGANQPRIASGGVIDTVAGYPAIFFSGTNRLEAFGALVTNQNLSSFIVLVNNKGSLGTTNNTTALYDQGSNQFAFACQNAGTTAYGQGTGPTASYKNGTSIAMATRANVQTALTGTARMQLSLCNFYVNGTWGGLGLMGYAVTVPPAGGGFDYQGYCLEEIVYIGNMDSKRVGVENYQRPYFGL